MTDQPNVQPTPDLADVAMKPAVDPASIDTPEQVGGGHPADPPAEDLTIPTE